MGKHTAEDFEKHKQWLEDRIKMAERNEIERMEYYTWSRNWPGINYEEYKKEKNLKEFKDRTKELEELLLKKPAPRDKNLTWEEQIFVYNYKYKSGEETEVRQGADWERLYGKAAANACSRLKRKKPTLRQFPRIIKALAGYKAKQIAINDMEIEKAKI